MRANKTIDIAFGRGNLKLTPANADPTVIRKGAPPRSSPTAGPPYSTPSKRPWPSARHSLPSWRGTAPAAVVRHHPQPVPNHLFLRPMIETMIAAGIPAGRIGVLVATGLHRPNEGEELAG
ncbi:MAG: lactate racemase domain-containing protein [Nannocystaceae bacterium]